jgi:predicted O-methyltransferase YrrM
VKESTADRMCICKPPHLVPAYTRLLERTRPATIVELGVARGGSTALLAVLGKPERLLAFELGAEPAGLAEFVEQRALGDRVKAFYGIDQASPQVAEIVVDELAGRPLDLVIDDASHLYRESRASFEMLFPMLRPGGLYVVEDWAAHHIYAKAVATIAAQDQARETPPSHPWLVNLGRKLLIDEPGREVPLSRLLFQLVLARSTSGEAVTEVVVDGDWFTVERGPAELTPGSFRLDDLFIDPFGQA